MGSATVANVNVTQNMKDLPVTVRSRMSSVAHQVDLYAVAGAPVNVTSASVWRVMSVLSVLSATVAPPPVKPKGKRPYCTYSSVILVLYNTNKN